MIIFWDHLVAESLIVLVHAKCTSRVHDCSCYHSLVDISIFFYQWLQQNFFSFVFSFPFSSKRNVFPRWNFFEEIYDKNNLFLFDYSALLCPYFSYNILIKLSFCSFMSSFSYNICILQLWLRHIHVYSICHVHYWLWTLFLLLMAFFLER